MVHQVKQLDLVGHVQTLMDMAFHTTGNKKSDRDARALIEELNGKLNELRDFIVILALVKAVERYEKWPMAQSCSQAIPFDGIDGSVYEVLELRAQGRAACEEGWVRLDRSFDEGRGCWDCCGNLTCESRSKPRSPAPGSSTAKEEE
jgi:hypothetical protein